MANPLLTVEQALSAILAKVPAAPAIEVVPLLQGRGRVLAADVVSAIDVPGFDNSAMDGYALAVPTAGMPARFSVVQRIAAGQVGKPLKPAQAARIFTGAPVPAGTTQVVMQEQCDELDGQLVANVPVQPGQHIRRQGEDIAQGQVILQRGQCLGAAELGLLASVGVAGVSVGKRLRVALLTTGDELTEPGQALPPGGIYNSNRFVLHALLSAWGCEVQDFGQIEDTRSATEAALQQAAAQCDVLISSGGVSVGEEDHVKVAVQALGVLDLWKIAMKPGKPLAFGHVASKPFIGLPGNPVSSFVTACLFARPFIRACLGQSPVPLPVHAVAADSWLRPDPKRTEFLRARLLPDGTMTFFPHQGSGVLSSMVWANALVVVMPGQVIRAGDRVEALYLPELTGA